MKSRTSQVPDNRQCETCQDDPMVCASIPGLRHCEAALRSEDAMDMIERVANAIYDAASEACLFDDDFDISKKMARAAARAAIAAMQAAFVEEFKGSEVCPCCGYDGLWPETNIDRRAELAMCFWTALSSGQSDR